MTNTIQDGGEAKRYIISRMKIERKSASRLLLVIIGMLFVEYMLAVFWQGASMYGLNLEIPYVLLVCIFALMATYVKSNPRLLHFSLTTSMTICTLFGVVMTFARENNTWSNSRFSFSRHLFSSFPMDFLTASFLGLITDMCSYINTFVLDSYLNKMRYLSAMMYLRGAIFYLTFFLLKILLKKKYDRLLKYDFLSNMQL